MAEMLTTVIAKGLREDLSDLVSRVAPEETPFINMIGKSTAKARRHEWQNENIRTPSLNNHALEGADVGTFDDANITTRLGNISQIFTASGKVSGTVEASNHAGIASDYARQKLIRGIELRKDKELVYLSNQGSQLDNGTVPGLSAGIQAWTTSNVNLGNSGVVGGYQSSGLVSNAVAGDSRVLTEAMVKDVLQKQFKSGSRASVALMGPELKAKFSSFAGLALNRAEAKGDQQMTIYAGADLYVSDFGTIQIVPHAYALPNTVLIFDPKFAAEATLRPVTSKELAATGDNMKFQLTNEATLEVKNEKAFGTIYAVTAS